MKDKIQVAYSSSRNVYDDVMTQGTLLTRLYNRIFWDGVDDRTIAQKVLKYIPEGFCGDLLDVPVGTAVFTADKYKRLQKARIFALDYSEDMLTQAEDRLADCPNVSFLQGDVGSMPFEDSSFDIVLCMNGMHVFPDKEKAYEEIARVLKPGGRFIACFYIKGESGISDWLVKHILAPKGWFNPPFQSRKDVLETLKKDYRQIEMHNEAAIVYFEAIRK